jgi:cellulose synthase/poly-beta-1,6-N-acetylglucosamine synthase-like glycosyltransferase
MIVTAGILFTVFYVLLIGTYAIGWMMIPARVSKKSVAHQNTFTILIAARNEAKVIEKCLSDIFHQHFPSSNFEVIVINDYSTDETALRVSKMKKAAITHGVSMANCSYIILTDADCERGSNWLSAIDAMVTDTHAKMIYAPVVFKSANIFEHIQALEFAGLVGIGAAAIRLNNPNMCSAANLIFEKQTFFEVDGYKGNEDVASGDDEYLLHKVCKRYPGRVHFLKSKDAIVSTSANSSLAQLAEQRKRWVSKSTKYENRFITAILVAAYLFNASIIAALFILPVYGIAMILAKMVIEGIFLFLVLGFFSKRHYLLLLPFAETFHILYVLIIGILANTSAYKWRGREIKQH